MNRGTQHLSVVDRLLDQYEKFGIMPAISGGDHEDDDDEDPDGNRSREKGGAGSGDSGKGKGGNSGGFKPITSQDDLDAIVMKRLRRQERSLREELSKEIADELREEFAAEAKARQAEEEGNFKELYEAEVKKTEKLQKKLDDMAAEVKQSTIEELRAKVADEFKLPADVADRLRGETEDELKADAKKLAEVIVPREAPNIDVGNTNGGGNKPPKNQGGNETDIKSPKAWGLPD